MIFFRQLSLLIGVLLLSGCAQQIIRDDASTNLRNGNFEKAIDGLELGVAQYPDSAALRASLHAARAEAVARLVTEAIRQRSTGSLDDANKTFQRALTLDPKNERVLGLQRDLESDRLISKRVADAKAALDAGNPRQALRIVEDALREVPRHAALLGLQRRLAVQQRYETRTSDGISLAETRPISLDFRGAPLSLVLDAITRGSGINFILDRDVRRDAQVTVFLRSATAEDAIDLVAGAQQLSRRTIDSQTVLIYPNTAEKQREHREEVVRVFYLANADAKATATLLKSMLRIKDPFVDERANLLALRESPEVIALAERLVALHDVGVPEVMLEVEILEVRTTRLTELGINFPSSFSLTPLSPTGNTAATVADYRDLNSSRIGVGMANILVNLRREVGDVNILANPRIRTKNKEKAHILIGDKVPVVTSTLTSTGFVSESVSYLEVGLKLDVEPVVSPDDEVSIKLALEVSSIANTIRTAGGSTVYQIGTRNASTALRLRDGETQLLAGLINNEDRSSSNRIPGLGDLPVAGRLFSSQKDDVQRTELVLAITPRIVHAAARPDVAQAEMWVGSELSTRLRPPPGSRGVSSVVDQSMPSSATPSAAGARPAAPANSTVPRTAEESAVPIGSQSLTVNWKSPTEVTAGEVFNIQLEFISNAALRSVPLEIRFPEEAFEVLEVAEGAMLRSTGDVASFTHAMGPGRISVGMLSSDEKGVRGRGELLKLRLRAKKPGNAELSLSSFAPLPAAGELNVVSPPILKLQVK